MPTKDVIEYTAHYVACTVLVDKDVDGGNVIAPKFSYVNVEAYLDVEVNDGYTFVGWYLESGKLYSNDAKAKVTPTLENVTYIAHFATARVKVEKTKYTAGTITVTNYGYINGEAELSVEVNEGFTFTGWYKNGTWCSNEPTYKVKVTKDEQKFVAHFDKYSVTYISEGEIVETIIYNDGTPANKVKYVYVTKEPTAEYEYKLLSWGKQFQTVHDDLVYEAVFTESYRKYEATLESDDDTAAELTEIESKYAVHDIITLEAKLTPGYSLIGWYVNGEYISDDLVCEYEMPTSNIKVVAKFKTFTVTATSAENGKVGHYVTYNYNYDKSPADEVVFVPAGAALPNKTVTRTKYALRAWFLDKECTTMLPNDYVIDTDITLYAGWHSLGNSGTTPTQIVASSENPTVSEIYKSNNVSWSMNLYYIVPADGEILFSMTKYRCQGRVTNITQNKIYIGYSGSPFYEDMTNHHSRYMTVKQGDVLSFYFSDITVSGKDVFDVEFKLSSLPQVTDSITCLSFDNTNISAGETVTVSAAANDGYTFMGWYNAKDELVATDKSYTFTMTKEDVNVVAKYDTARVIAESSNTNLGTVSMPDQTSLGSTIKLEASSIPTSKTCAFLGWYDEDDNLVSTELTIEVEVTTEVQRFIAKYDTVRVLAATEDSTIGTVGTPTKQQYIGANVDLYVTVKNKNYSFAGWYLNGELVSTNRYYKPVVTQDVTQYVARFGEPTLKLTSNLEGTTQATEDQYIGYSVQISSSSVANTTFLGWYDENDELVATGSYTKVNVPAESTTLTAKYKEGFNIKAVADVEGAVLTIPSCGDVGSNIEIKIKGIDGYTFMGWYLNGERVSKSEYFKVTIPVEEVTYVAHFDTPRVVVTVNDTKGGTVTIDERVQLLSDGFTYIEATAKTGYKFVGWYLNGELAYTDAKKAIYMSDTAVTYEARFEKIEE